MAGGGEGRGGGLVEDSTGETRACNIFEEAGKRMREALGADFGTAEGEKSLERARDAAKLARCELEQRACMADASPLVVLVSMRILNKLAQEGGMPVDEQESWSDEFNILVKETVTWARSEPEKTDELTSATLSELIQGGSLKEMEAMLGKGGLGQAVAKAWAVHVVLLGKKLLQNGLTKVINRLLEVAKKLLYNTDEAVRRSGFEAWDTLEETFIILGCRLGPLPSKKKLKLLSVPYVVALSRGVDTYPARCWEGLLEKARRVWPKLSNSLVWENAVSPIFLLLEKRDLKTAIIQDIVVGVKTHLEALMSECFESRVDLRLGGEEENEDKYNSILLPITDIQRTLNLLLSKEPETSVVEVVNQCQTVAKEYEKKLADFTARLLPIDGRCKRESSPAAPSMRGDITPIHSPGLSKRNNNNNNNGSESDLFHMQTTPSRVVHQNEEYVGKTTASGTPAKDNQQQTSSGDKEMKAPALQKEEKEEEDTPPAKDKQQQTSNGDKGTEQKLGKRLSRQSESDCLKKDKRAKFSKGGQEENEDDFSGGSQGAANALADRQRKTSRTIPASSSPGNGTLSLPLPLPELQTLLSQTKCFEGLTPPLLKANFDALTELLRRNYDAGQVARVVNSSNGSIAM